MPGVSSSACADLLGVPALDVAQHDHLLLARRQLGDRGPHLLQRLGGEQLLLGHARPAVRRDRPAARVHRVIGGHEAVRVHGGLVLARRPAPARTAARCAPPAPHACARDWRRCAGSRSSGWSGPRSDPGPGGRRATPPGRPPPRRRGCGRGVSAIRSISGPYLSTSVMNASSSPALRRARSSASASTITSSMSAPTLPDGDRIFKSLLGAATTLGRDHDRGRFDHPRRRRRRHHLRPARQLAAPRGDADRRPDPEPGLPARAAAAAADRGTSTAASRRARRTASGPAGPAAATAATASAIAATWRWSVPQHPPNTLRFGSCGRQARVAGRQVGRIAVVELGGLVELGMAEGGGVGAQRRARARGSSRPRAPSSKCVGCAQLIM